MCQQLVLSPNALIQVRVIGGRVTAHKLLTGDVCTSWKKEECVACGQRGCLYEVRIYIYVHI